MSSGFVVYLGITIFGDEPLRDQEVPYFIWVRDLSYFMCYYYKMNNVNSNMNSNVNSDTNFFFFFFFVKMCMVV